MSDAIRWTDEIRLFPNHTKDLVRTLLRAGRHAVRATNAESMINLRVQGWGLYQALLGRRTQGMQARPFFMGMPLYVPDEDREDGNNVQQSLNYVSQDLNWP